MPPQQVLTTLAPAPIMTTITPTHKTTERPQKNPKEVFCRVAFDLDPSKQETTTNATAYLKASPTAASSSTLFANKSPRGEGSCGGGGSPPLLASHTEIYKN
mmetsp:Transcript_21160/g.22581  ORF Transcript_21160/g.22581 Transcript_21160/m.22581 type:complete len:102 (+) Transcript_21160:599-904(+)